MHSLGEVYSTRPLGNMVSTTEVHRGCLHQGIIGTAEDSLGLAQGIDLTCPCCFPGVEILQKPITEELCYVACWVTQILSNPRHMYLSAHLRCPKLYMGLKSCVMLPAGGHRSFQILATCI